MKRPVLALCAGLLLLGLVPGSVLAIATPINLDQHNNTATFDTNSSVEGAYYGFAQTFTAGKTGMLSGVDLYLAQASTSTLTVEIGQLDGSGHPGAGLASGSASVGAADWYYFSFSTPLSVTSGLVYDILCAACANAIASGTSADSYTGGYAMIDYNQSPTKVGWEWGPVGVPDVADFAFRTYVDQVTTTLNWDKSQVPANASTPLTLTETFTFSNGPEAQEYGLALGGSVLGSLPAWFTPATIACTYQDDGNLPHTYTGLPECPVTGDFQMAIPPDNSSNLATLTIVVTGTAHPAIGDAGTVADVGGESCLLYGANDVVHPNVIPPNCAVGTASVGVGVQPVRTPPPTTTYAGSSSADPWSLIWFLPMTLIAACGGLVVMLERRRRRVR